MTDGGFVKIYGSHLLKSTLWEEAPEVRLVFLGMLALANKDGFIAVPLVRTLARLLNLPVDYVERGLDVLEAPDMSSRSKDHDGRRLLRSDSGWQLVNHAKYRELRTEKQVADAERQLRSRKGPRDMSQPERDTCDMSQPSRDKSPEAEAKADTDTEAKAEQNKAPRALSFDFPLDRCISSVNAARKKRSLAPLNRMQGSAVERLLFAALEICQDVEAAYAAYLKNGDEWDSQNGWPIARWAKTPMHWLTAKPRASHTGHSRAEDHAAEHAATPTGPVDLSAFRRATT